MEWFIWGGESKYTGLRVAYVIWRHEFRHFAAFCELRFHVSTAYLCARLKGKFPVGHNTYRLYLTLYFL